MRHSTIAATRSAWPAGRAARMELTNRKLYTVLHGLILGTLFLLAFAGGLAGLWSLRERLLTT